MSKLTIDKMYPIADHQDLEKYIQVALWSSSDTPLPKGERILGSMNPQN
jgi:hypothetical protein